MKQTGIGVLALVALLAGPLAWGAAAAAAKPAPRTTLGKVVIIPDGPSEYTLGGMLKFTQGVTVTTEGLTLKCETLKVWPGRNGKGLDRLEATGNVRMTAVQTTPDGITLELEGRMDSASYNSRTGLGELRGDVHVRAVDAVDRSVLTIEADVCTYDHKTQLVRFDRGGKQVKFEWEPAPEQAKTPPAAPDKGPAAK